MQVVAALKNDVVLPITCSTSPLSEEAATVEAATTVLDELPEECPNVAPTAIAPEIQENVEIQDEVYSDVHRLEELDLIKCNDCGNQFSTVNELNSHVEEVHDKRGSKRHRSDTSLLPDPVRPCSTCQETSLKVKRVEEQHSLTQTAYEDVQKMLDLKSKEASETSAQVKMQN